MNQEKQHITLVGIGNHSKPQFTDEILNVIQNYRVFSGGKRHEQLVKHLLPKDYKWIEISGNMQVLVDSYTQTNEPLVVFASGDPLFYGFGNTLKRLLPQVVLEVYPYFSSIQRLCHKTQTNYNTLKSVSVHGRDWTALDEVLIKQESLIGVLTDGHKTPVAIAQRMIQYGFNNYKMIVGEALDGAKEKIQTLTLQEAVNQEFDSLNCVLLVKTIVKSKILGKPDANFHHLPNRANMITKMPIRLITLSALKLKENEVFWDIGACTGSIAIEAKSFEPTLKVIAFEKREVCGDIIQQNKERFSTPGIQVVIDDFFDLQLENYPKPDVVFVGGHGGRLKEMITIVLNLNPNVRMVTNAVQSTTSEVFCTELQQNGFRVETTEIKINEHNKIKIHEAIK